MGFRSFREWRAGGFRLFRNAATDYFSYRAAADVRPMQGSELGSDFTQKFRHLSDDDWLALFLQASEAPQLADPSLPTFPAKEIQKQFVGSAYRDAMREASNFYQYVKTLHARLGLRLDPSQKFLDFGCGWGRFIRLFAKDFDPSNIYGVDVDPEIIDVCRDTRIPGHLLAIEPRGRLPAPDATFALVIAYSVFTHLPEDIHLHWMEEIARCMQPGAIFALTLEPRRFLDFVLKTKNNAPSGWHEGMSSFADTMPVAKAAFDRGEFVYLPTGGGNHRPPDVYGEAIAPLAYIEKEWSRYFEVIDYTDDASRFWQAVLTVRRKN